jgi:type IV pilus assembly protein PilC
VLFLLALLVLVVPVIQLLVGKRHADQSAVLWTLAISLETELPLVEELDAVAGTLSRRHARKTRQLAERLRNGDPLSEALRWTPGVIPQAAILAAQVGEQNGVLPAAMSAAAVRHTKTGPGNNNILSATSFMYPVALLLIATLIVSFLMYYIVPKFKRIFSGFDAELPPVTQQLMAAADTWVQYYYLYVLLLWMPLVAGVWALKSYWQGWGESDVPWVGRWFRRLDVPGVLRNLATTVTAGRPLDDTLLLLAQEHRRRAVRSALKQAGEQCRKGDDCWYSLRDAGLLNAREVAALRSAQRVGNLAWALGKIAETIERRVAHRWLTIVEVAQPATVLGLGLIVGAIQIGFFAPLVSLILDLS